MACFTACFPASNHKKLIKSTNNDVIPSPSKKQCLRSLLETDDESEVISMKSSQIEDSAKHILDSKDEKEEGTFDLDCNQEDGESMVENEENKEEEGGGLEISTDSSFFSLPLNHLTRRRGCKNCDEEDDGESLFSLSIDSVRQKSSSVNQNCRRDSNQSVQSEPNQIQNSSRPRKEKKIAPSPLLQELQEKENLQKLENSAPTVEKRGRRRRKCNKGFGKRPILGALNWNLISRN